MLEILFIFVLACCLYVSKFSPVACILCAEWFFSYGVSVLWIWLSPDAGFEYALALSMAASILAFAAFAMIKHLALATLELVSANVIYYALINDAYFYSSSYDSSILFIQLAMLFFLFGAIYGRNLAHIRGHIANFITRKIRHTLHKS